MSLLIEIVIGGLLVVFVLYFIGFVTVLYLNMKMHKKKVR